MSKDLKLSLTYADVAKNNYEKRGNTVPYFAFVSPPEKGRIRALVALTYCRETVCEYVRQELRNIKCNGINTNKLHMVAYRRVAPGRLTSNLKTFEQQVLAGQQMANLIEKNYGWPLTKVYPTTIDDEDTPENCKAYYIRASKRWIKSPIMLSLYTLLFRIAARGERKFKFRDKMKSLDVMFATLDDAANKSSYQELAYYRVHGTRWKIVLDNYNTLFGNREMLDLYFPQSGWYFTEGINKLCDEHTGDFILKRQFKELVAKHEG